MKDTPTDQAARLARQRHTQDRATARQRRNPTPIKVPSKTPLGPLTALVSAPLALARSLNPHRSQSPAAVAAFYGTVGALVALELIEWPLGVIVVVGHALASGTGPTAEVGKAVEEAAAP